jgi:hypothetical protein
MKSVSVAVALGVMAFSSGAYASAIIEIEQQGANVVATGSGTLDLADLFASFGGFDGFTAVSGQNAYAVLGPVPPSVDSVTFMTGLSGPAHFGSGPYTVASSGSGDRFGIDVANGTARLWVAPLYHSGSALSATDTWDGATLAGLGLDPGVYTYSWGTGAHADTLQVRIGATTASVPEPSMWAMMLGGFGLMGGAMRARRKSVAFA